MKERPILMSAPMVQATLVDKKTQTRRLIKKRPRGDFWRASFDTIRGLVFKTEGLMPGSIWPHKHIKCPYGQIGDHLWVRESFYQAGFQEEDETRTRYAWRGSHTIWYAEDEGNKTVRLGTIIRKIPSIYMPRWASRITLEITNIRVGRLGDISETDCIAEGIEAHDFLPGMYKLYNSEKIHKSGSYALQRTDYATPIESYISLWEAINGPGSWERDREKFVWVIEFKRIQT